MGVTAEQRIATIQGDALLELEYARKALQAIESELSSRFIAADYVAEKTHKVSQTMARLERMATMLQTLRNDLYVAYTYVRELRETE